MALPWSFLSKITNSKHPAKRTAGRQITNTMPKAGKNQKLQITNSKPVQRATQVLAPRERLFFLFGILNFGHCYLPALLNKS